VGIVEEEDCLKPVLMKKVARVLQFIAGLLLNLQVVEKYY